MTNTPERDALVRAVELLGGPTATAAKLSKAMGVTIKQPHVSGWLYRSGRLPPDYALHMEHLTAVEGERITAAELCPRAFDMSRYEKQLQTA